MVVVWRHSVWGWFFRLCYCDNNELIPHNFQILLGDSQVLDRSIELQTTNSSACLFWTCWDGFAAQSHGENRGSGGQRTQLLRRRGAGIELGGGPVSGKLHSLKPSVQSQGSDDMAASVFVPWPNKIPGKPAGSTSGKLTDTAHRASILWKVWKG